MKTDFKALRWEVWTGLVWAKDGDQWRAFVNTAVNPWGTIKWSCVTG